MKKLNRRQWLYAAAATAMATACGGPLRGAAAKVVPPAARLQGKDGVEKRAVKSPKRVISLTAEENSRPGDRRWRLDRLGAVSEIEGWAANTSVKPGETVNLHISTTAPFYRITAFRTGWYAGTQARMV